jgi:hypothetical protein
MKFHIGQRFTILQGGQKITYEVREGEDGEPFKHRVNTKTRKVAEKGSRIKINEKIRLLK